MITHINFNGWGCNGNTVLHREVADARDVLALLISETSI